MEVNKEERRRQNVSNFILFLLEVPESGLGFLIVFFFVCLLVGYFIFVFVFPLTADGDTERAEEW